MEIAYGIDPLERGKRLGTALVARLVDYAREQKAVNVLADIQPANVRSIRAVESNGFKRVGESLFPGQDVWELKMEVQ